MNENVSWLDWELVIVIWTNQSYNLYLKRASWPSNALNKIGGEVDMELKAELIENIICTKTCTK